MIQKSEHKLLKAIQVTYNVEILNSFNPELKDTESAIKSKLKKLLSELRVLVL